MGMWLTVGVSLGLQVQEWDAAHMNKFVFAIFLGCRASRGASRPSACGVEQEATESHCATNSPAGTHALR